MSKTEQRALPGLFKRKGKSSDETKGPALAMPDTPLADARETVVLLIDAFENLLRGSDSMPVDAFAEHVESYNEAALSLVDSIETATLADVTGLQRKSIHNMLICRDLFKRLSQGYQQIAARITKERLNTRRVEVALFALNRALESLGKQLEYSYRAYSAPTPGTWHTVHEIYRYCLSRVIPAADRLHKGSTRNAEAVTTTYKKILLLALLDPYKLSPLQWAQAGKFVNAWARHLVLRSGLTPNAQFAIDLGGDAGPVVVTPARKLTPTLVSIITARVSGPLEQHLSFAVDATHSAMGISSAILKLTDAALINILRQSLSSDKRTRSLQRHQCAETGELAIGVGAAHFYASDESQPTGEKRGAKRLDPRATARSATLDTGRFASKAARTTAATGPFALDSIESGIGQVFHSANRRRPLTPKKNVTAPIGSGDLEFSPDNAEEDIFTSTKPAYPRSTCRIINETADGACLLWRIQGVARVAIGEIIAVFRKVSEPTTPMWLGSVKWIKVINGSMVMFGVEKLPSSARPLTIRAHNLLDKQSASARGWLLERDTGQRLPASLLTPVSQFEQGQELSVQMGSKEYRVRLTDELGHSPFYRRFAFSVDH